MTVLTDHLPLLAGAPNGIKKLRELILELAVRGSLVPQDSSEGDAAQVLKQSREERAGAMLAGSIKKEKPATAVQAADQPFNLPNGWAWCRVVDTGNYINGLAFSARDWSSAGRPIIRIQNLSGRNAQFNRTSAEVDDSVVVNDGDILVSWSATLDAYIWRGEEGVLNQHIFRVEPSGIVAHSYLYWLLKWVIRVLADSDHSHGLVMAHINRGPFLAQPIGLPPLEEQRRIIAKVDELMALCDTLEAQQANAESAHADLVQALLASLTQASDADDFAASWERLSEHFDTLFTTEASIDALKQTVLQLAVMGKLVPQDPGDEPASELLNRIAVERLRLSAEEGLRTSAREDVPDDENNFQVNAGWEVYRLGNLARFIDYRGRTPTKTTSGVPLLTAKNVRPGFISVEPQEFIAEDDYPSWMTRGFPRLGDMLFTTEAPLGNVSLIDIPGRFALAQRVICLQLHERDTGPFFRLVMMSSIFQFQLTDAATGMTATGIKSARLKELPVPIPPLAEQHRIVAKVDELMALCDQLKSRIRQARDLNQQLASTLVERAVA